MEEQDTFVSVRQLLDFYRAPPNIRWQVLIEPRGCYRILTSRTFFSVDKGRVRFT